MATPIVQKLSADVDAAAAGTAQTATLGEVERAGSVARVRFIANATLTGAATNFRTLTVVNKGSDGTGTTVVASLAFSSSGVVATAGDELDITLSATAANRNVAAGDVLSWVETIAASGLAQVGGRAQADLTDSAAS